MEVVVIAEIAVVYHSPCVGLCREISSGALLSMLPDA